MGEEGEGVGGEQGRRVTSGGKECEGDSERESERGTGLGRVRWER